MAARFLAMLLPPSLALAQAAPTTPQDPPEISSQEQPAVFRTRVQFVLVPVVVRDRAGNVVGGLRKEDFTLLDEGKSQEIIRFSVQKQGAETAEGQPGRTIEAAAPDRFVAYLFDDTHLKAHDLANAREAALRHIAGIRPEERVAVFTTSDLVSQDFTDNRDQLRAAITQLREAAMGRSHGQTECPRLSYYMADQIRNRGQKEALAAAVAEIRRCRNDYLSTTADLEFRAQAAAERIFAVGENETRLALEGLRRVIRRLSTMPGRRTLVMVSPGFLSFTQSAAKMEVLDLAIRLGVVVNTLDPRGTDSRVDLGFDTELGTGATTEMAQSSVLAEVAAGTGGKFIQQNDLEGGLRKLTETPETVYVLGFSPQNLRLDGKFHPLKVSLRKQAGMDITARLGYYAPTQAEDAAGNADREIEAAVFSREVTRNIPMSLHTQFFKSGEDSATLTVVTRIDAKALPFLKEGGRNRDVLTLVAALFDRNGNYVSGVKKAIDMRLRDETLEKLNGTGISINTGFDVRPGAYAIRVVVRDAEGQMMSAGNGSVEIP